MFSYLVIVVFGFVREYVNVMVLYIGRICICIFIFMNFIQYLKKIKKCSYLYNFNREIGICYDIRFGFIFMIFEQIKVQSYKDQGNKYCVFGFLMKIY